MPSVADRTSTSVSSSTQSSSPHSLPIDESSPISTSNNKHHESDDLPPPTSPIHISVSRAVPPYFSRFHTPSHHPSRACNLMEIEEMSSEPSRRRHSSISTDTPFPLKNDCTTSTTRRDRRSSLIHSLTGESPSLRGHDKWHHYATWFISTRLLSSTSWKRQPTLGWYCFWSSAILVVITCFIFILLLPTDYQVVAPTIVGSFLSLFSSITILISFLSQPQSRRYPNQLLVYVALCECGLSICTFVHVISYCSISSSSITCSPPSSFNTCAITTAVEMFLHVASVGWFGCAILHLFVSVSNPFANYKSQMKRYHLSVWGCSMVLSLLVPFLVFSDSAQTEYEMNRIEMCRTITLHFPILPRFSSASERTTRITQWQILNLQYWGAFFALVVLLVMAAQLILAIGWWRSNSATVIALRARRTMMKRMTTYVHTLNATWLIILVLFFWYRSNPETLEHIADVSALAMAQLTPSISKMRLETLEATASGIYLLDALFHFILSAKGYFTCVVWVAVNRHCWPRALEVEEEEEEEEEECEERAEERDSHNFSCQETVQLTWTSARSSDMSTNGSTPELVRSSLDRQSGGAPWTSSMDKTSAPTPRTTRASICENNETLQREIIYYTVCGITQSILKSARDPHTDLYFQELMVGVPDHSERVSMEPTNTTSFHKMRSPYCQPRRPVPYRIPNHSMVSKSLTSRPSVLNMDGSERDSFVSGQSNSLIQSFHSNVSTSSPHGQAPRGSMYPVSHVPFELFEQQLDLQSQRSSAGARSLSPLFSSFRRRASALYHHHHTPRPHTPNITSPTHSFPSIHRRPNVDRPRPKLFIDYAPMEFRMVRQAFGLSDESYLSSFRTTAKEQISAGSSGAFLFYSGDNALIVKSMKEKECRKLIQMIPTYTDYIINHPHSRIIRFFGCHRIRLYGRNFYFVVMSNVLSASSHTVAMQEKYDVKGSWIDRQAKEPQVGETVLCAECQTTYTYGETKEEMSHSFPFHTHRPDTILKDLDFQRSLYLSKPIASVLYAQLVLDAEFLQTMGIMDYSLLIGVHKCSHPIDHRDSISRSFVGNASLGGRPPPVEDAWKGVGINLAPIAEDGDDPEEMYFIGIIDILQEWNWEKQLEKVGKTLLGKSSSGISAVAPSAYCERFKSKVAQVLMLDPFDLERADAPLPAPTQDGLIRIETPITVEVDEDPELVFIGVIDTSSNVETVHKAFEAEVELAVK